MTGGVIAHSLGGSLISGARGHIAIMVGGNDEKVIRL